MIGYVRPLEPNHSLRWDNVSTTPNIVAAGTSSYILEPGVSLCVPGPVCVCVSPLFYI